MKKHLTTILSFAMMFVAFTMTSTLTSCGEEVIIDGPNDGKGTKFSAGISDLDIEGTRTTLDSWRTYFWQFNDQIWVNVNGTWLKSSDSELSPDKKSANFFYDRLLTADSYEVVYTGYNSTSATKVTIPTEMTSAGNSGFDIGNRGDCGVATAERQADGTYKFSLLHKASYLGVAPLVSSYLTNNAYRWTKIEVSDVNGKALAGTFDFSHANGIDVNSVTSPSNKILLKANGNTSFLQSYNATLITPVYVVLPPSDYQLNVKYYFVNDAAPTDTMKFTKTLNSRQFIENNVVQFRHGIAPDFYRWDAPVTEPRDLVTNTNQSTVAAGTQATRSCATMPNVNEMYWYLVNGDPRWDSTTEWTNDGGASYQTGGVWVKKKSVILAEGKTFDSNIGKNGVDMRTSLQGHSVTSASYVSGGKPADTSKYFFLPAQGVYWRGNSDISEVGLGGYYWSSSSSPTNQERSYVFKFYPTSISIGANESTDTQRSLGCIAGKGSDWFK